MTPALSCTAVLGNHAPIRYPANEWREARGGAWLNYLGTRLILGTPLILDDLTLGVID